LCECKLWGQRGLKLPHDRESVRERVSERGERKEKKVKPGSPLCNVIGGGGGGRGSGRRTPRRR